jgi:hypothetical protein
MGCEDVRDLLTLYAGGECHDNERIAVEAHVSLCSGCARELDQYREARAALAGLAEADAPEGAWKELWSGVRGELFPRPMGRLLNLDVALRCAAALMVGLAIGVVVHALRREAPAASTSVPAAEPRPAAMHAGRAPEPAPFTVEPRPPASRARIEGNFYLPRVEAIPAGGEKDF